MTEKKSLCDKRQKEKRRINKTKRRLTQGYAMANLKLTNFEGIGKEPKDLYWYFNVGTTDHTRDANKRIESIHRRQEQEIKMQN